MEQLGRTGRVQSAAAAAAAASQPGSWFCSRLDRAVIHYNTQRRDLFPLQLRTDSSASRSGGFVPVCSALPEDLSAGSSQVFRSVPFFLFFYIFHREAASASELQTARRQPGSEPDPTPSRDTVSVRSSLRGNGRRRNRSSAVTTSPEPPTPEPAEGDEGLRLNKPGRI